MGAAVAADAAAFDAADGELINSAFAVFHKDGSGFLEFHELRKWRTWLQSTRRGAVMKNLCARTSSSTAPPTPPTHLGQPSTWTRRLAPRSAPFSDLSATGDQKLGLAEFRLLFVTALRNGAKQGALV